MKRGFSFIALDNPKSEHNLGSAVRAGFVFGAAGLVYSGKRLGSRYATDPQKAWRHFPIHYSPSDIFDFVPTGAVPVAVELIEGAKNLVEYVHPERAFYIFGGEDATLGARILGRCRDTVQIPARHCLNLAAAVNVVLYDRVAKRGEII